VLLVLPAGTGRRPGRPGRRQHTLPHVAVKAAALPAPRRRHPRVRDRPRRRHAALAVAGGGAGARLAGPGGGL